MFTNSPQFRARGAHSWLGALALGAAALASGCTSDQTPGGAQTGGAGAGTAGTPAIGAGTGPANTAGSVSSGGMVASAGSGGSSAGVAGGAGTAGSMPCAADDECCNDPLKTAPGECGCGTADADGDKDGTLDCKEECPFDANKVEKGDCGCGLADNDSDDDGEIDCQPGHYYEAEDGLLSEVDAPVTPVDTGEGGAGGAGAGGADVGGAPSSLGFSIGDDADASKEQFLESPAGVIADGLPGPARASYEIDAPVAGSYRIWVRLYTPDRDHNRVWVRLDNGTWMKLRATTGETWFWYAFHKDGEFDMPIAYELTKGVHTLAIASNTDGVKIDRFYVTPGLDKPPGDATTCNPPHTIQSAGVCLNSCGGLTGNSCDAVLCAGKTLLPAYDCEVCCKL